MKYKIICVNIKSLMNITSAHKYESLVQLSYDVIFKYIV